MTATTTGPSAANAARPRLLAQAPDQWLYEDQAATFTLPPMSYSAPDGTGLIYAAFQVDGSSLPSWLQFDPSTLAFTATAPASTGVQAVMVTATSSNGASSAEAFHIYTRPRPPVLEIQEGDQRPAPGASLLFTLPAASFTDPGGHALAYSASLADGSALPSWLAFDASTDTFSGQTPPVTSTLAVEVTATDSEGVSVAEAFHIYTRAPAPVLVHQAPDQRPEAGSSISFSLPAGSYADASEGSIGYVAMSTDGSPLPSWLSFDAVSGTFSGTAPDTASTLGVKVVATSSTGASAAEAFHVYVQPAEPVFSLQSPDRCLGAGETFSFQISDSTFTDPGGGAVAYTAEMADGSALPSWLSFDASTDRFSGTLPAGTTAAAVRVDATTASGGTAAEAFHIYSTVQPGSAMRASDFTNAIGVDTHLSYFNTAYSNLSQTLSDLAYIGVTHARDGGLINDGSDYMAVYESAMAAGIKFDSLIPADEMDTATDMSILSQLVQDHPGGIDAVEGINEVAPNTSFDGLRGNDAANAFQGALYAAVHSTPALHAASVYNYTSGTDPYDPATYTDYADTPAQVDFDNAHLYFGAAAPDTGNWYLAEQLAGAPSSNYVVTETGYDTMPGVDTDGSSGVNQDVQAKYTLDDVMDLLAGGASKVYLYELLDELPDPGMTDHEQHFGLFNNDGTPKEVATALHDLMAMLSDTGLNAMSFRTASLAYTISGLPVSGESMLMEKSNGSYDLAVWAQPEIWNSTTLSETTAPQVPVTVQLGQVAASVEVYDPLSGTAPIATYVQASQIMMDVSDHPLIIEIDPSIQATLATSGTALTVSGPETLSVTGSQDTVTSGAGLLNLTDIGSANVIEGGPGGMNAVIQGTGDVITTAVGSVNDITSNSADITVHSHGMDTISISAGTLDMSGGATVYGGSGKVVVDETGVPGTFIAGTGTASVQAGSGGSALTFGTGTTYAYGGSGVDLYTFIDGTGGGKDSITGFDQTRDHLLLSGFSGTPVVSQSVLGGSLDIVLSDQTTLTLVGIHSPVAFG